MLYPTPVARVEQISNPELWQRFVQTRKDMLRSKTDDMELLSKLGLNENELLRSAHLSMNFDKNPSLLPYSDNMVLLFHCTRSQANHKSILSQGLDERLSSVSGGLLGKGIYFADDPNKSIQYDGTGYIFIFAVLLGDCISVDHLHGKNSFVREPEKAKEQKRNFNDLFFDSIVARPAGFNEYVIYNRYQCCPLYQIKYMRNDRVGSSSSAFNLAAQKLPPIAWIPSASKDFLSIQNQSTVWPFFAVDIFASMGAEAPADSDDVPETMASSVTLDDNLAKLNGLGYVDEKRNRETLLKFNNNIEQTVNYLLDNDIMADDGEPLVTSAAAASNQSSGNIETIEINDSIVANDPILIDDDTEDETDRTSVTAVKDEMDLPDDLADWALECEEKVTHITPVPEMEDCSICCNSYDSFKKNAANWKELKCSHRLCVTCYGTIRTTRFTMSGTQCTFVKCPFCQGMKLLVNSTKWISL